MLQRLIRFGKPETPYFLGFPAMPGKFFFKSSKSPGKLFCFSLDLAVQSAPHCPAQQQPPNKKPCKKQGLDCLRTRFGGC